MEKYILIFLFILFKSSVYGQEIKNIFYSDTSSYNLTIAFNKNNNLIDLRQTKDSFFVRIRIGTISSINSIYEFSLNNQNNKFRRIYYGQVLRNQLYFGLKIFAFEFNIQGIEKREDIFKQVCIEHRINNNYFITDLLKLNLLELKAQKEIDSSINWGLTDGVWYDIEISTPNEYRYVYWSNPDEAPKQSEHSKKVIELIKLTEVMDPCEKNTKIQKYKKEKWP